MMENICKISVFPYKLIHLYGNTSRLLKYMGISSPEYYTILKYTYGLSNMLCWMIIDKY
jgi:hypothetical protein